jgi:hypothetical protein
MGGLKQDLNINRYPALACKSFENVTKIRCKKYDEEGINLNTNTSKHGNNNQFMTVIQVIS